MSVSLAFIVIGLAGLGCGILGYQLLRQHLFDDLTGLPRQVSWVRYRVFGLSRDRAANHWAIVIDVNRFNTMRYCMGRGVSDRLLVSLSARIQTSLQHDERLMRTGEDEFTIILPQAPASSRALDLAHTIRRSIAHPFVVDGQRLFVNLSIGVASSDGNELHETMGAARVVMYRAKATGQRYPAVFDTNVRTQSIARLQLEIDLRESISQSRSLSCGVDRTLNVSHNSHNQTSDTEDSLLAVQAGLSEEFRVHYQPIVNLHSGRISGFEALVRWDHPQRGRVSPADFIPVCEETGLIVPLGYWVLQEACHQVRRWFAEIPTCQPLFISVNVSSKQLQMPDFTDRLRDAIRHSGISSDMLRLEITEGTAMEDVETTLQIFRRIRSLNVNLGIDDFGTGYSSLSYLHRLPFHSLKIDQSFVKDLEYSRESQAITRTIVALAQTLKIKTIAEGIETKAQLRFLSELGCNYGQGYLFSRPLPAPQASTLLMQPPKWCAARRSAPRSPRPAPSSS